MRRGPFSHEPTHHTVTEGPGASTAIAVSFGDDPNAYNALTRLAELDSLGRVGVQEAVVVAREDDDQVVEKDRTSTSAFPAAAGGGLIGLLIGVIGGPFGMLLGGTSGLVVGSLFDLEDLNESESALAAISGSVKVGRTALLAVVSEQRPEVLDAAMAELGGTIVRRPVFEIEAEIAAAQDAERDARREARKEMVRAREQQTREAVRVKVAALKDKLHAVPAGAGR